MVKSIVKKGWWRRIVRFFRRRQRLGDPLVIPRARHTLSRADIAPAALKVLYRLKEHGHQAYLVGGSVRDLLLGRKPKDFDIATDAHPETVRQIFRNSRIIGRRFRLVHVVFQGETIEVSTFRANTVVEEEKTDVTTSGLVEDSAQGMIRSDNTYGTVEEDAWRRDFTVNALYYNIQDFSVEDYTGGMLDLKDGVIRMIGDPVQRFHEDPGRLLRAIRLAAKLRFTLEPKLEQALRRLSNLLMHVPKARLFDEILKLFFEGNAEASYEWLCRTGYWTYLFPQATPQTLIEHAMRSTDQRLADGKTVNPAFLLAVIGWSVVQKAIRDMLQKGTRSHFRALCEGIRVSLSELQIVLGTPKRFLLMIRAMWLMQHHLERCRPSRALTVVKQRHFRAAYDFLTLRMLVGEVPESAVGFWTALQEVPLEARAEWLQAQEMRQTTEE